MFMATTQNNNTKVEQNMTRTAVVYADIGNQTMLVVDTDLRTRLDKEWEATNALVAQAESLNDITDPMHVVDIQSGKHGEVTRKQMIHMLPVPAKYVQAILVSTTSLD
jgi:hypothetical protein